MQNTEEEKSEGRRGPRWVTTKPTMAERSISVRMTGPTPSALPDPMGLTHTSHLFSPRSKCGHTLNPQLFRDAGNRQAAARPQPPSLLIPLPLEQDTEQNIPLRLFQVVLSTRITCFYNTSKLLLVLLPQPVVEHNTHRMRKAVRLEVATCRQRFRRGGRVCRVSSDWARNQVCFSHSSSLTSGADRRCRAGDVLLSLFPVGIPCGSGAPGPPGSAAVGGRKQDSDMRRIYP